MISFGCHSNVDCEKYQKKRNNCINISDRIIDIKTDVLFGNSFLDIFEDILIVTEVMPRGDKGIHLFNKNTFKYITSTAIIGKGPGEVTQQGRIGVDLKNRALWVSDHGKRVLWYFPLDSILINPQFKPSIKKDLYNELFMVRFSFLNDSLALGKAVHVINHHSFDMAMAKLNIITNKTEKYGYEHPEAVGDNSNSFFKLSVNNNIYVNCYINCDLLTICDLKGNLKYNVYGPGWGKKNKRRHDYFCGVDVIKNLIVTGFIDDVSFILDVNKRLQGNSPSKFLIFDIQGNYLKTLETKSNFSYFCVDEENSRVIVYFNGRENPLGYFTLNVDEL